MISKQSTRHEHIDEVLASEVLERRMNRHAKLLKLSEDISSPQLQVRCSAVALNCKSVALLLYALGYPLAEVSEWLHLYLNSYFQVLGLRGTSAAWRSRHGTCGMDQDGSPCGVDYSLGNSWSSLEAMTVASTLGLDGLVSRIAQMTWDPSGAEYIGSSRFSVFSKDKQKLAYLFRDFVLGEGLKEYDCLLNDLLGVSRSLIFKTFAKDEDGFIFVLRKLLYFHEQTALARMNINEPGHYICFFGLSLTKMAIMHGLEVEKNLPRNNGFFPLEIFSNGSGA